MRKLKLEPLLSIKVSPLPVPNLGLPRTVYPSCCAAAMHLKQRSQDHTLGKTGRNQCVIWSNFLARTVSSQRTWHMIACRWFLNISALGGSRMPL